MRDDVRDAIDAARLRIGRRVLGRTSRCESFEAVRQELLRLIRDLPEDLTISDLRQELE